MVYLYIVAALYVLVEFLELDKVLAYAVVYLLAYVMEYTMTLLFVFRARFKYRMTVKYVIYVAGFLTVSTLTYKAMLLAGIDYLPCRDPDRISAVACPLCRQQILGLSIMSGTGIDRRIMHALLIATGVFAFWTVAHQVASFAGISWTSLTWACAWLAVPVFRNSVLVCRDRRRNLRAAATRPAAGNAEPAEPTPGLAGGRGDARMLRIRRRIRSAIRARGGLHRGRNRLPVEQDVFPGNH